MKIAFAHRGVLPVKKYGGIERMLFWHMKELVRQGHEAVLIGHPDCQLDEYGIEHIPMTRDDWWHLLPKNVDGLQLFYNDSPPVDVPIINTVGGNGQIGETFHKNTVFVSRQHALNHNCESFVYNALDFDEYPFTNPRTSSWDNFLFLAKASWSVKNLKHASQACRQSRKHLHICGGRSYRPSRYLHNYGMVGGATKLDIIKKCDALLFPIRWHEPFGLAVVEAMAMGLPVFASPYGSMPELINEQTGLICRNKEELIHALKNKPYDYNPQDIRAYVEEKFSIEAFTSAYIKLFDKLIKDGGYLNETAPTWVLKDPPLTLLPF